MCVSESAERSRFFIVAAALSLLVHLARGDFDVTAGRECCLSSPLPSFPSSLLAPPPNKSYGSDGLSAVLADNAATIYTSRGRELANQIATLTSTGAILNETGVTGDWKAMQEALWGMAAEADDSITCPSPPYPLCLPLALSVGWAHQLSRNCLCVHVSVESSCVRVTLPDVFAGFHDNLYLDCETNPLPFCHLPSSPLFS